MTVSNGMLTFAPPGLPKMPPQIDKKLCREAIPYFDAFFTKKCSQSAPKIDQKSMSWPTWGQEGRPDAFLIDFSPIWDAL